MVTLGRRYQEIKDRNLTYHLEVKTKCNFSIFEILRYNLSVYIWPHIISSYGAVESLYG